MAVTFKLPKSIPWITQQSEPSVSARTLVDERFDTIAALTDQAKLDFDAAISEMQASLSPIVVGDLDIHGITVPDLGGDIPSFTGVFDKTFTATLEDFEVVYVEPEGKPDPTGKEWEDGVIALEPELIAKVASWLVSDKTAIPDGVLQQIYEAAAIQIDEAQAAAILKLESDVAARGWELPSGVLANQRLQIEREYAKSITELSGNLAGKNMELTQANYHKAVEVAGAYVSAAQDYIVKKNQAKIQWYSAAVDAWIKQVDAAIKVIDAKVAAFNGQVEAYKSKAIVYKTEADVFDSTVRAYAAMVDGMKAKIEAVAETVKMQVQVFQVESNAMIEEEKLKVQAQSANQNLAMSLAQSQSQLHAQMVASGLSAMHVQASVSASHGTGQDVRFSYSYGESMDEKHSESIEYSEKK